MGSSHSGLSEDELQHIEQKTGFSQEQIGNLHKRFQILTHNKETLRREDLEDISDLKFNPIRNQIIQAFFDKRNFGPNETGTVEGIGFEEFITVMSHFQPIKQNLSEEERKKLRVEKLHFLFNMHDKDNDGRITLNEYRGLVEELLSTSADIEEETVKEIADAAMREVATVTVGEMAPDEVFDEITFEHFLQILNGVEIESKMYIRFLHVDTSQMDCRR